MSQSETADPSSTQPCKSDRPPQKANQRYERVVALFTIFVPFAGLIAAVAILFGGHHLGAVHLWMFLGLFVVTTYGLTMGYHRLFTHKSFKCVAPIRAALCIAGSMAAQGPVIFWVACHRKHHMFSDEADDPHSPHFAGGGLKGLLLGWWHAHMGWMVNHTPENYFKLAPDLLRDRLILQLSKLYFVWVGLGILIPGIVGGLVSHTAMGFVTGLLWGGLARIFFVHHTTWSINSVCHLFGSAPFRSEDESRNNVACALLTFGEGWHNNHHAFPTSARHGLFWWQLDMVYIMIRGLERMGLATDVRVPDTKQMQLRRRQRVAATVPDGKAEPLPGGDASVPLILKTAED